MKYLLTILIVLLCITSYSQEYLLQCKSEREANKIERRFYRAGYANDYFCSDSTYYIELDSDDLDNNWTYGIFNRKVIKKRYYTRIFIFRTLQTPVGNFKVTDKYKK